MEFKSTSVVKHPINEVWSAMRDHLPEIAGWLDDIESVTLQEKKEDSPRVTRIVNVWRAAPKLPALLTRQIRPEMLAWTDFAEWHAEKFECRWRIKPHAFSDRISCQGHTKFESAIGGRGTRINFAGSIEMDLKQLKLAGTLLEGAASSWIGHFVSKLIPGNFVKVTAAVSKYLSR